VSDGPGAPAHVSSDSRTEIATSRLLLRQWRPSDREPFAALNVDPRVMEHFPHLQTRAESDASVDRFEEVWREHGFGQFAVEVPGLAPFIGFVGLGVPSWSPPFPHAVDPVVEIGWRLAAEYWGRGYAVEAATAVKALSFTVLGLPELLSWTVPANARSRRVMERLGMSYVQDFEHPVMPEGSPVRRHVLYRVVP
jgi:RimJ/RimL family protein N-acetyltransferase